MNENKKGNKFIFVDNYSFDEENTTKQEKNSEILDRLSLNEVIEEEPIEQEVKSKFNKIYIGFETRICLYIVFILIFFLSGCFITLSAFNFGKNEVVSYKEESNASYKVCLKENNYYNNECLDEGLQYLSSLTNNINIDFNYNVQLSSVIDYKLTYHVNALVRIYDSIDHTKVLYENENTIIAKHDISDSSDKISFSTNTVIDYKKYNDSVTNYINSYAPGAIGDVDIILYLDEESETRKISSVNIPLATTSYGINKEEIKKESNVSIDSNVWTDSNSYNIIIGTILILVSLFLLIRVTRLIIKGTTKKTKYYKELNSLMKEYDKYIVIARDGFIPDGNKKTVKVDSFKELMDAREALNKPIIYSKVNDIKCEFIIEDIEIVYKYTMKESDN